MHCAPCTPEKKKSRWNQLKAKQASQSNMNNALFNYWAAPFRGCPVIIVGRLCRKTVPRGREDTRVWYRETMFAQMVSYDFLLHEPLHGYFLYLVCAPPEKPTRRCEPEEGYLRCSKWFDHGSNSTIFLLFEFKSVRWCWRWETQRNARVAFKPTRRSR